MILLMYLSLYVGGGIWKRRNNFKYENDIMSESEFFQWVKCELQQHFALIKKDNVHMKICKHMLNIL